MDEEEADALWNAQEPKDKTRVAKWLFKDGSQRIPIPTEGQLVIGEDDE